MSATSEALAKEAFFAIGVQSAKGTAATTLYKAIATTSSLSPRPTYTDTRAEHPAAGGVWARSSARKIRNTLAGASVSFVMRPSMLVPVLLGLGYQDTPTDNTTYHTHTLVQGTNAAHKWLTVAWSIPDSDGTFVKRGVDMRISSATFDVGENEITCTAEFRGLTVENMAGSPTYISETVDEIVPWQGTRTNITVGDYPIVERVRGMSFSFTNTLNEEDPALWEATQTSLARTEIDLSIAVTGINMSDDVYNALTTGLAAGTTTATSMITGDVDVEWESVDNISGAAVPFRFRSDTPSVEWELDTGATEASGVDLMTTAATAYVLGDVGTPSTIVIDNAITSY